MSEPIASPRFRSIVAAIDFSAESERALAWAKYLAVRRDAELVLVHAVVWPAASDALVAGSDVMSRELLAAARRRLDDLKATLLGQVRAVSCVVAEGYPVRVILDAAREHGADLVVVGTRGLTGWQHVLLGSTAQRVIAKSECPVLAVHATDPLPSAGGWLVLAATDGSSEALAAVRRGLHVVGADAAQVVLLHAFEGPSAVYPATAELFGNRWVAEARRMAEENLASATRELAKDVADVAPLFCEGFPPEVIVREARRSDLVVVGTRGAGLGHLFLGSTAERVAQRAEAPVLVIPHAAAATVEALPIVGAELDPQC